MRPLLLLLGFATSVPAAPPAELAAALASFRSDPPPGWSYTQTTTGEGKSTVERYDASRPMFNRWSLLQKDGRTPTPDEVKAYEEGRSRRSRAGTAPSITEQIVLEAVETVSTTPERVTYRAPLRPGESADRTAPSLRATIVVRLPSRTIESIELANIEPFSPTFGVKITAMRTTMTYSPPAEDRPVLPLRVTTHLRGRAFLFKSLDADMTVEYSDYARARK